MFNFTSRDWLAANGCRQTPAYARPVTCSSASLAYQATLSEAGITVSMSRKGNNAVMARFWGTLKSECTDGKRDVTRKAAKSDVMDYVEMFYNAKRWHSTVGYLSPVQFEKQFLLQKLSTLA